ncbi:MAG: 3-demethylubiquinone-9 3-methyltransferase [Firmicutes bacterium ADurb.Bin419]|nr:MAG: 3-demethylubiquinone-9 3-methyltransferase [Firmicutes bacterium ADurb.Bin419]
MLTDSGQSAQKITPNLLFSNESCGKAEEAVRYYTEVFKNSETGIISRYKEGEAESPKAKINYAAFKLDGIPFSAMDNGFNVDFSFNEAFSLIIKCEDQEEIDYFWDKLSAVPEAEQCGWVKDKFGVSWQIVPAIMDDMMKSGDREKLQRVTEAFMAMKKFDLEALQKAYDGV